MLHSVLPPLFLRDVTWQPAPLPSWQTEQSCPVTHAAILLQGTCNLPPRLLAQLKDAGVRTKTFDVARGVARQQKALAAWVQKALSKNKSAPTAPLLIVDLLALSLLWEKQEPADAAIALSTLRLHMTQCLQPHASQVRWLACTQMGRGGRSVSSEEASAQTLLLGGATHGFVKSLAREWDTWCRAVDLHSDTLPERWLLEELADASEQAEAYYSEGQRWLPLLRTEPNEQAPATTLLAHLQDTPDGSPPVLVWSGGGSGITARIAMEVARHLRFRALVLGRTALPDPNATMALSNKAEARRALKQKLGDEASPRRIQEALKRAEKQVRLAVQLHELEALGAEVLYVATDMNDADAVTSAVQQAIRRWGRIDAVIHGAGIDQSRDLANKTADEVEQVMRVKLRGLAHLRNALRDQPVRSWLAFSSVSARFGNEGQVDYAAANDAMTRWLCHDPGFADALVIDFTAWDDVGMAASLATFMKERGVDILPAASTALQVAQLWLTGHTDEWVFSGRLPRPKDKNAPLGRVTLRIPGAEVRYEAPMRTGQALYMTDHKMGDTEIQPGVVSLAWMQLAARDVASGAELPAITEVRFTKALKLFPRRPLTRIIHALRVDASHEQPIAGVQVTVDSTRQRRGLTEHTHHASATFAPLASPPSLDPLLSLDPKTWATVDNLSSIYETFFHGPTWQVLGQARWHDTTLQASLPAQRDALGQGLPDKQRWDAVALELLLQAAGLWSLRRRDLFVLPYGIERLVQLAPATPDDPLRARLHHTRQDDDCLFFDGVVLGAHDRVLASISDLQMRIFPIPT